MPNLSDQIKQTINDKLLNTQLNDWRENALYTLIDYARENGQFTSEGSIEESVANAVNMLDRSSKVRRSQFKKNKEFMTAATERFFYMREILTIAKYVREPERLPRQFRNNKEAYDALRSQAKLYRLSLAASMGIDPGKAPQLTAADAIQVLRTAGIALTRDTHSRTPVLYAYDYDKQLYSVNLNILKTWLTAVFGVCTPSSFQTLYQTLEALPDSFAVFNPPPPWKIAVGNGMLDLITKQVTPSHPAWTVTRRISTCYNSSAEEPAMPSGKTFDELIRDLANHDPTRVRLIKQMCKTIITGFSPKPSCFIIHGRGGDGKSLFMKLMSNVVGHINTGHMSIKDLNKDDALYANADASLVIGFDNSARATLSETGSFKSLITGEPFIVSRKYLSAVPLSFQGTIVELCNEMPRILETGSAIKRRIVTISAENSHYEQSDEIEQLESEIRDRAWHEYILRYIADENTCPFFTDYEDIDSDLLSSTLKADDLVEQFIDELHEQAVLTKEIRYIPVQLLYACYLDWMDATNPQAGKLGSRSFVLQLKHKLAIHGFTARSDIKALKLSHVLTGLKGSIELDRLSSIRDKNVDSYIEKNMSSTVLERTRADVSQRLNLSGVRLSDDCSAHEYFDTAHVTHQFIERYPWLFDDLFMTHFGLHKDELTHEEHSYRYGALSSVSTPACSVPTDNGNARPARKHQAFNDFNSAITWLKSQFTDGETDDPLLMLSSIDSVVTGAVTQLSRRFRATSDATLMDKIKSLNDITDMFTRLRLVEQLLEQGVISNEQTRFVF